MKATLSLPYYDYNDGDFDVRNDYYSSDEEYFNVMNDEIQKNSKIVERAVNGYANGGSMTSFKGMDGQTYSFSNKKKDKISYSYCDAIIYNEEGKDKSVDEFVSDYVGQDVTLVVMKLDMDTIEEEFEEELNLWYNDHNKLQPMTKTNGEDWVFEREPTRNVNVKFVNNAKEEKNAQLLNCKILEKQNIDTYIIICEKVLIKN